jgi:hypothetical protein
VFIKGPEIIRGTMPPGNASVDGSKQFMQTSNCHPWLMAIVDVKGDGLIQPGVMNTLDQPVTIQSGQKYDQVTLTCDIMRHTLFRLVSLPSVPGLLPPLLRPLSPTPPCGRYRSTPSRAIRPPTGQMAPQSHDRPRNN